MNRLIAAGALLALAGCQNVAVPPSTPGDAVACAAALALTGLADPAALISAALREPACASLASDVLNGVVGQVAHAAAVAKAQRGQ